MNEDLIVAIDANDLAAIPVMSKTYQRDPQTDGVMSYAYLKNPTVIPYLVEAGIPIDERDTAGNTILMHAAAHGNVDLIDWLCAHGAALNASNDSGETPFSFACTWDQLDAAMKLYSLGANPSPVFEDGTVLSANDRSLSRRIRRFLAEIKEI